jgi:[ribosomal protein S5]-alanine N-acetyltransferase
MSLVLETQRLWLKPIVESQLSTLHRILTDPYVRKYLCDDQAFSLQQVKEMISESNGLFKQSKFGLWLIETKDHREIIGVVGLWYFFAEAQPQLLYALLPESTKQGYATEAASKILDYCFDELGYEYLLASCDLPNLESCKLAERIGMSQIEEKMVNGNPLVFFKAENPQV